VLDDEGASCPLETELQDLMPIHQPIPCRLRSESHDHSTDAAGGNQYHFSKRFPGNDSPRLTGIHDGKLQESWSLEASK